MITVISDGVPYEFKVGNDWEFSKIGHLHILDIKHKVLGAFSKWEAVRHNED